MPVKSFSDAVSVDDAIWDPFCTNLGPQNDAPGRQKSLKSIEKTMVFDDFAFLVRIASGPRFGTLPGSIWRAFCLPDGSNMASKAPKSAPRRPKEPPRRLLYASRAAPASPKTPPRPPPAHPRCPQASPRASKTAPRALQERFLRSQALPGGGFQDSSCCPAASSLWPASGLGGMREA